MLVKAFNNIYYKHLLSLPRPGRAAGRSYRRSPGTPRKRRRR
ncbi:MAG: hypothetical protein WBQ18_09200 [Solirubrobacteraceae bacterium]